MIMMMMMMMKMKQMKNKKKGTLLTKEREKEVIQFQIIKSSEKMSPLIGIVACYCQ